MATRVFTIVSPLLFLFLLVNYNNAAVTKNEANAELKDNDYVLGDDANHSTYLWEEDIISEGQGHVRKSREAKKINSLKIRLEWFHKTSGDRVGQEYSRDLNNDGTVIEQLGMSITGNVNNGGYDVLPEWVPILQPYFKHRIDFNAFDYQVAFDYREWWEDMRVISFDLFTSPYQNRGNDLFITLTPGITGEVVRAIFKYYGHNDPSTMIRIYLLGTSIDAWMNNNNEHEFFPTQKQLVNGQAFEAVHSKSATKTNHNRFSIGKPLQVTLTLTVRVVS